MMSIPGVKAGSLELPAAGGGKGRSSSRGRSTSKGRAAAAEPDDGFTPDQRRKNQLDEDPGFKKYRLMISMRQPLINVRKRLQGDTEAQAAGYTIKDLDLYASPEAIEEANKCMF